VPSLPQDPDLISLFVAPLEREGFSTYMISGSVAAIEYGEPRATLGIDVLLPASSLPALGKVFPEPEFYLPPEEVLQVEVMRPSRGHFNIIHSRSGLKADCYPSRNHLYLSWALQHRVRARMSGIDVWLAPPEYVILWKLEFHREGGEISMSVILKESLVSPRETSILSCCWKPSNDWDFSEVGQLAKMLIIESSSISPLLR